MSLSRFRKESDEGSSSADLFAFGGTVWCRVEEPCTQEPLDGSIVDVPVFMLEAVRGCQVHVSRSVDHMSKTLEDKWLVSCISVRVSVSNLCRVVPLL